MKYVVRMFDTKHIYLRHPRRAGFEVWDEKHDAKVFDSYWSALWQALRHFGRVEKL